MHIECCSMQHRMRMKACWPRFRQQWCLCQPDSKVDIAHVFVSQREELAKVLAWCLAQEAQTRCSALDLLAKEVCQGSNHNYRRHHPRVSLAAWVRRYQGLCRRGSLVGAQVGGSQRASLRMRPNPTLRESKTKYCNNSMLPQFRVPLWHYFFCFVSYCRFNRLTRAAFYSQCRIYFMLLRLRSCAFSDMDSIAAFALHGYCNPTHG